VSSRAFRQDDLVQSGESQAFALLIGLEAVFLLRNKFACPTSAAGQKEPPTLVTRATGSPQKAALLAGGP
jgi:hypothetical protein